MARHRGIQFQMRLKELAEAIGNKSVAYTMAKAKAADITMELVKTNEIINVAHEAMAGLTALQLTLITAERWTEFGLPAGMTTEYFESQTGTKITS